MILSLFLAAANLLLNPSFEDWPDGETLPRHWTTEDTKTAPYVVSRLYALGTDGQYALRFTNGKMQNALSQRVRVTPGKYYSVSCDAKIDVTMYCFEIMPFFLDKDCKPLPFANFPKGNRFIGFTEPWTHLYVKNMLAPTNAVWLSMRLASNDSWSGRGVIGNIDVDNVCVCESGSIFDEKPVAVSATDRLEVLAADLKPTCDTAGVLVRAGKEPVTFTLRAEEPIDGGKVILGGEKAFTLKAGEERSCFLPLETSDVTTRLTVFVDGRAVWRKAFAKGDRFLRVGLNDPFDIRKNEIFVPNDRKWYTHFPIDNNLVAEKGNRNRVFGNPTNLNARFFFEVPETMTIFGIKYSDWGGDLPFRKPLAAKPSVWNGVRTVVYELPVYISRVNRPLVIMKSSLPADTYSLTRAWATWDGGRQVPQEFRTKSVSFGTYKPFERMNMRLADMMPNLMYALSDDPVNELPTLGVNAMRMEWEPSKKNIAYPQFRENSAQLQRRLAREMKASKAKWFFYLPNELSIVSWVKPMWNNHANMSPDPSAAYLNIDGQPQKAFGFIPPCPNYRGTNFLAEAKWVLESEAVRELGITWIILDWEFWGHPCYCDRCRKLFREKWCPEHKLPDFGDPKDFMRDERANAAAAAAFKDFFMYSRGRMYADFKKELDKGLDPNKTDWSSPIEGRFMISDWIRPKPHLVGCIDSFEWMFAFRHPKHGVEEADKIFTEVLKGKSGAYTCSVCPAQGCETCYTDAPIGTYYNMFEAASLGAAGFEWYYAPITDAMTWKYVMDGLRAIRPFEDIVMDGAITVRGKGEKCTWRRNALLDEALYCVRDYACEKPQTASFEVTVEGAAAAWDCASHEKLADLKPGKNRIKVALDADHQAKLVYVGARFEERQNAVRCEAPPLFGLRAVQLDLARQKETVPFVKDFIRRVAKAGYTTVVLYLEDRIKTPSYPYSSDEDSYSISEMKEIVRVATDCGVDLVPVVSPLGHTDRFLRHEPLKRFSETYGCAGRLGNAQMTFCLENPEARAFMEKYLGEVMDVFPGKNFHMGFDETDDLGFCDRCRPLREKMGLGNLFAKHVRWAHDVAARHGKRMWIWDDYFMFFPEALEQVPRDVVMCAWNYCEDLETTGLRNNFGGRQRRDVLKEYERLGFDCVVCPWFDTDNIRRITDYAAPRKCLGALQTQWEMAWEFHGCFFPRVLATAELWRGAEPQFGDGWLAAGVRKAMPSLSAEGVNAVVALFADQPQMALRTPSVERCLDSEVPIASVAAWKGALAVLKREGLARGADAVADEPLGEAALFDDIATRTEMAIILAEARTAARPLTDPSRRAETSRAAKAKLQSLLPRWDELCRRRADQWRKWRPGEPRGMQGQKRGFEKSVADLLKISDAAADDEWLLEADLVMADAYGAPRWRIEGRFDGAWRELAAGGWKPALRTPAYFAKRLPVRLAAPPDALRVRYSGYGEGELCHVSLYNRARRLVPVGIGRVEGDVRDAAHLLADDFRPARFGLADCTAAVLNPSLAETESFVEIALAPSR